MNWNNDEGPWGSNGDKGSTKGPSGDNIHPWSSGKRSGGGGGNGRPPEPPDFDELLKQLRDFFSPYKPQGHFQALMMGIGLIIAIWLLSGLYMVGTNQLGVVMRFGAYERTENPGLRYHLPAPIESVLLPVVTSQNEIQIGFRQISHRGVEHSRSVPEESMMLTQDQNLINVQFAVFWRIDKVNDYLFEIRDPEITIKMAAESVMREVIGQNKLQFALTEGRGQIAEEARIRLQALVDEFKAGISVTQINLQTVAVPDEVKAAFQDVVNARLDKERLQNQAAAHVNKVIPEARGQAAQMIQEAMGYRDQKIAVSKGDADRFTEVYAAYKMSKSVTTKRLYLETMEDVLRDAQKVITDSKGGTMPLYPVHDMLRKKNSKE